MISLHSERASLYLGINVKRFCFILNNEQVVTGWSEYVSTNKFTLIANIFYYNNISAGDKSFLMN